MKELPVLKIEKIELSPDHVYGKEAEEIVADLTLEGTLAKANELKNFLGIDWKYLPGRFPQDFQNYTSGWNASPQELEEAGREQRLLFLNLDLEDNGCSRRCSHCYTMDGEIDVSRGRKKEGEIKVRKRIPSAKLIEQIAEAKKELGLKAVRILGRGEPTESPYLLEFTEKMAELGVQTLIFTRGHVIGNDAHAYRIFHQKHGVKTGEELVKRLFDNNTSIILGYSAINDMIHNGMVGIKDHSHYAREGLKRLLQIGFRDTNPTRLGIEAPIAKLNMQEMPASYILFQCLGISPVYNAYMVTGRSDEEFFQKHTPSLDERVDVHAQVIYSMRRMGIKNNIGAYLGTKECHDVEHGLYVPSTGQVFPCPGYESRESIRGDLNTDNITKVWKISQLGRKQHICEPKVAHGFPLDYAERIEKAILKNQQRYAETHQKIIEGLGIPEVNQNKEETIVSLKQPKRKWLIPIGGMAAAATLAFSLTVPYTSWRNNDLYGSAEAWSRHLQEQGIYPDRALRIYRPGGDGELIRN